MKKIIEVKVINNVPEAVINVSNNKDGGVIVRVDKAVNGNMAVLGNVKCGDVIFIEGIRYIVLGHGAETTAVVTTDCVKTMPYGFSNNWKKSDVRKWLNSKFYHKLAKAIGVNNIVMHKTKLIAEDGSNKGEFCRDNVSLLTLDLYRRYREYLKPIDNDFWLATSATNATNNDSEEVCNVRPYDGTVGWNTYRHKGGVRPFLILDSSILVKVL